MDEPLTTADALLEATVESIHRFGLTGTTVSRVSEVAGVSRGMVRHNFGSKQVMVERAFESLCDSWTAATEPDPALGGEEQVLSIVRAMFAADVFTDARVDAWLALSTAATSDPGLRQIRERAQERWLSQLRAALDKAGAVEAAMIADGLLGVADGLWLRRRLEPAAMTRQHAELTVVALANAALGVR